jgi:PIN domain nuclease of toxin-antitoxin system
VILLDTHIWVWWVQDTARLTASHRRLLRESEAAGLAVSAISCWEVAKLVELGRLSLPCDVLDWLDQALVYPGMTLLPLTAQIAVASKRLPGVFHRDPADQIIVATARELGLPLVTVDQRILDYPHVDTPV